MGQLIQRVLGLRGKFGTGTCRRILIQKLDVKSAFRQVGADPTGAANLGYGRRGHFFYPLAATVRVEREPRVWWGVIASAIQQAQRAADNKGRIGVRDVAKYRSGHGEGGVGVGRGGVRRLLQLSKLHLNGQKKGGGGGGAWGRGRKKAEARRVRDLTEELMADVEW